MPAASHTHAALTLAASLIPALIGLHAWRLRGTPGATTLALLMWTFALWGVLHALESMVRAESLTAPLYEAEQTVLLAAAPLWLVFTLQYTGRERWLTRARIALLAVVPLVTLALILTNGGHNLMWSFGGFPGNGGPPASGIENGPWFWVDFVYRTLLVAVGCALLVLMLTGSQRLYGKQSLCLLVGFLAPYAAVSAHQLRFGTPSGFSPPAGAFLLGGLALALAFSRYRLLDIAPVAHDAVVEGMSDGTIVLDRQGRVVDINPSAEHILGCPASEVVGQPFRRVLSSHAKVAPLEGNRGSALFRRYEERGKANEEIRIGEGENARHYDLALSALYDARDRRTGQLIVLHEITERKLAAERLDRMARYDDLTGLPNRAFFHERLTQEIARTRRTRRLLALLFLDLDRFKAVNDTLGHEVGDMLLKETAARISAAVREYDVVSRLAGDEFTVILPDIADAPDATVVAERIVESLAKPFELAGNEIRITTSIGICFCPTDGTDPAALLKNADTAMYRAKTAGKNRYELFTRDTFANAAENLGMEAELARALENGELVLRYRPEMSTTTTRMIGVETLTCWERPGREPVYLDDLVALAEESGLIFTIERWVLRESCRQMRSWQERYPTDAPLTVAVNISARHFVHPNLVGEVSRALSETDLPPECLVLDIKEDALNEDPASATATLQALKSLGIKLAVDGFGAGSSSLAHLKRFPLDALKIDRSFIVGFRDSEANREIVSAVISLAHALGLRVVAEGVETAQVLMQLKEMGCDSAQGDYFAEPLSGRGTSAFLVADLYY